jgi:hypothetical protein
MDGPGPSQRQVSGRSSRCHGARPALAFENVRPGFTARRTVSLSSRMRTRSSIQTSARSCVSAPGELLLESLLAQDDRRAGSEIQQDDKHCRPHTSWLAQRLLRAGHRRARRLTMRRRFRRTESPGSARLRTASDRRLKHASGCLPGFGEPFQLRVALQCSDV